MKSPKKSVKFSPYAQNLIASLRGFPSTFSRSRLRNTLSISDIVDSASDKFNIGKHTTQDIIMANWQHIMGEKNAQRACPSNVQKGHTLIVKVSNPIVRNELQFQIRGILQRLQALPQCQKIKRILFVSG